MITDAQKWLVLISTLLFIWLVYRLTPILTPFLIGIILAYLGNPAVNRLEKTGFSRTVAVVFVFLVIMIVPASALIILLPLLQKQIAGLIMHIPDMINVVQSKYLGSIASFLEIDIEMIDLDAIRRVLMDHWQSFSHIIGTLLEQISQSGQTLLLWTGYLVIIPVVTFYMLRDWGDLLDRTKKLIPRKYQAVITKLAGECDVVLGEFFRGQLLVMLAQSIIYSTGLWIVGLEFALLIGILAGLVSFVPYLGFFVGFSIAGAAAFFQFHELSSIFYVLLVFGIGQAIEGMLLSPLLIGDRIGLHPAAVIFAVMAGGQLFGFFGVLLALPVASMITVLLRHAHRQYLGSSLYTE